MKKCSYKKGAIVRLNEHPWTPIGCPLGEGKFRIDAEKLRVV